MRSREVAAARVRDRSLRYNYFSTITYLCRVEFHVIPAFLRQIYESGLLNARRSAAQYAFCRRLSKSVLRKYQQPHCQTEYVQEDASSSPRHSSTPSHLEPCRWLPPPDQKKDMPYYVWDVMKRETRIVEEILDETGKYPEYVAISHTWGRWKTGEWSCLPGVPWRVPRNTRFNVEELPELLEKLQCRFVWIDLLAIPQEELSEASIELQKIEISRQAGIFRLAQTAIAWLNDISTWTETQGVLIWLSLAFHKFDTYKPERESWLAKIFSFLRTDSEGECLNDVMAKMAVLAGSTELCSRNDFPQPNAWFTSLWTLQEACLRPDMFVCNEKWEMLAITNDRPLSLSDIVALSQAAVPISKSILPAGVSQLSDLLNESGMSQLLKLSRPAILGLGDRRVCGRRRAEAIMSAIGTCNWFDTTAQASRDEQLVMGRYSLAFLEEAREAVGSAIFFSFSPAIGAFDTVLSRFCIQSIGDIGKRQMESIGSLLPFGRHANLEMPEDIGYMIEHPSLKTWKIDVQGRVKMSQVGLLDPTIESCWIFNGPDPDHGWRRISYQHNVNLREFLNSYTPWMPNYAISLVQPVLYTGGIILKEVSHGVFIRVATFWIHSRQPLIVQPRLVDWTVL